VKLFRRTLSADCSTLQSKLEGKFAVGLGFDQMLGNLNAGLANV